MQLLLFALCTATALALDSARAIPPDLHAALENALADIDMDFSSRLNLVKKIDSFFEAASDRTSNEIWLKAKFVEAVANLRLNRLDLSSKQIRELQSQLQLSPVSCPELRFRCRSLSASLALTRGERAESRRLYEELLSGDVEGIPSAVVDGDRTNYAMALYENGLCKEATELYESIMFEGLEHQNDRAALHAGYKLLSMLISHEEAPAARHALDELKPIMARNRKLIETQFVSLSEMDLLRLEGKGETAISSLREFINQVDQPSPILLGSAHRRLADALCHSGELDQANFHAKTCVDLLQSVSYKATDAFLTLANVHLLQRDYQGVLEVLDQIDPANQVVPERRMKLQQMRLLANLGKQGRNEDAALLLEMIDANNAKNHLHAKSTSYYFDSRLEAVHRSLVAQQAYSQARSKVETDRLELRIRYLLYTLLSAAALGVCLILYVDFRRRSEMARLAEQRAQNERLEAIVESKTQELTSTYKAQSEMSQALERKKRAETIGLLAGNVAHDINNLLQVIANSNEALADMESDENERKRLLGVSNASLRHGSGIIKQLLAYSRRQELSAQSIPVQEYLSECRSLLHSAVGDRILLTIEEKSGDSSVFVDPSQLTTTLLNILNNAADSMPHGGQINLSTSRLFLSEVASKNWNDLKPGNYLHFVVSDTGCGMNSEQLSRAFEPFFTTKVEGKGTGLGLSSVYGFVKQSGGEIKLKSELGVGTKVEFLLPLSVSTKSTPAVPAVDVSNVLENKRLLLVEDHEAVAKSLMILLSRLKLQCQWVISGQEAIERLRIDSKFDFVLSDVHMPGSVDGLALTRWIKAELPEITALLMSGFHDIPFEDFESPVLPKPFNLRQLAGFLTEHSI